MKQNLLFVICGEGLGHTSRSLKLATHLEREGYTCHIAAYGKSYDFLEKEGKSNLHRTFREVSLEGSEGFFSLSKTLWASKGLGLNLLHSFRHTQRLIREHSIDLVIADTMYAAAAAAHHEGVRCIFITNQNRFSTAAGDEILPWRLLSRLVSAYLRLPDEVLIPDFRPPETVCEYNLRIPPAEREHYHFTGPMMALHRADIQRGSENIFASFGGEAFKIPLYGMLRKIADRRPDFRFEVFSTASGLPAESQNFHTYGYVPDLYAHLAQARVAVLHGGLTTLHEALYFGKPCVMIIDPHHPEQWNNARKVVDLGAGVMVEGDSLTEEGLSSAIRAAAHLSPPDFREIYAIQDGRVQATERIEELLKGSPEARKLDILPTEENEKAEI